MTSTRAPASPLVENSIFGGGKQSLPGSFGIAYRLERRLCLCRWRWPLRLRGHRDSHHDTAFVKTCFVKNWFSRCERIGRALAAMIAASPITLRAENAGIHLFQRRRNVRPKLHLAENIPFEIDARRDLDQLEAAGFVTPKHRALGDEERPLAVLRRQRAGIAHLLDLADEFLFGAFAADLRLSVGPADVEAAGGERAAEDHLLGVLADIDEAADADDLVAEAADIDVAAASTSANDRNARSSPPPS